MKKLLTILTLTLGLLFGSLALASTATAGPDGSCGADGRPACPTPVPCGADGQPTCPPTPVDCGQPDGQVCDIDGLVLRLGVAEQTANDYRAQTVALRAQVGQLQTQVGQVTAKLERAQATSARRAATIKRLRAKIRALR